MDNYNCELLKYCGRLKMAIDNMNSFLYNGIDTP